MKIVVVGASGKIGKLLVESIINHPVHQLVAAIVNKTNHLNHSFILDGQIKYCDNIANIENDIDVAIDFSSPNSLIEHLDILSSKKIPLVTGTTGFSEQNMKIIALNAQHIPILMSANFSLGIAIMKKAAMIIQNAMNNWDIEIIETHHRHKKDAPSGTALMLAQALQNNSQQIITSSRFEDVLPRNKNEIGISAVRGGNVMGEHIIRFMLDEEEIAIEHRVNNRQIFVSGALKSAEWLINKKKGLYNLDDVVN